MGKSGQKRIIKILDTTLRDGEQAPGCSMNLNQKIDVAKRLELLGVDVIEAGFPASSPGDSGAVKAIAENIKDSAVAGLCRCRKKDIEIASSALSKAVNPVFHLFLATSPIHMEYKLKMKKEDVLSQAAAMVKYARQFCAGVEFSAEDAGRSDPDFLCAVFAEVVKAGAGTVNIPDTVGYVMPDEFSRLVRYVKDHTPGIENVVLSAHCHNDLGLAVANSLAAVSAGAGQIECTINGIGERAGNASLEEIVMALRVREDILNADTRIDTTQIYATSRLVSQVTGVKVQPNKAVVGENAFAHEAGIHQHGVLAKRETYEIMSPESIGVPKNRPVSRMVLGKHSGRNALGTRLAEMGFHPDEKTMETVFLKFKELADKKKTVSDRDLEALIMEASPAVPETWKPEHWAVNTGSALGASGTIRLQHKDGKANKTVSLGDGPIDSIFKAINHIIGKEPNLELYEIGAITGGSSSQGEALVKIRWHDRVFNGMGVSTDIIEASIKAYIAAVNAMEWELKK